VRLLHKIFCLGAAAEVTGAFCADMNFHFTAVSLMLLGTLTMFAVFMEEQHRK